MSDLREAIQDCIRSTFVVSDAADAILALLREHGLVELDADQNFDDLGQEVDAAFQSLLGSPMKLKQHWAITVESIAGAFEGSRFRRVKEIA